MKWIQKIFNLFFLLSIGMTIGACSHQVNVNVSNLYLELYRFPNQEKDSTEQVKERHLVFDIDWTIVKEIKEGDPVPKDKSRIIVVEGKTYYVNEGVEEFIEEAEKNAQLKISFFSGGSQSRNNELLSKIKLKNGKSLLDISYKVLSKENLIRVPNVPETAKFAEKNKKDLTLVSKALEDLTMLDDTDGFVYDHLERQSDSVYFIGKAFLHFDKFEDTLKTSGEYVPKTYEQWLLDRKKMWILKEAFKEAFDESLRTGMSLRDAMNKQELMMRLQEHEWNDHTLKLFKRSGQVLPKRFRFPKAPPIGNCQDLMKVFITF